MNRKYNAEHIEWLKANIVGCHFKELTDMFNNQFGMDLKVATMVSLTDRHGLHNGLDTQFKDYMINAGVPFRFKKGHVPFNKGKKGIGGWEPTQFSKGHRPANYRPVGSERTNVDGYVELKVAHPRKWVGKHTFIWEEHNGLVPKGHVVIFGDGNRSNFDPNNLLLVSRKQLVRLNQNNLIQKDTELTKTAIIMADIYGKIGERRKGKSRKYK